MRTDRTDENYRVIERWVDEASGGLLVGKCRRGSLGDELVVERADGRPLYVDDTWPGRESPITGTCSLVDVPRSRTLDRRFTRTMEQVRKAVSFTTRQLKPEDDDLREEINEARWEWSDRNRLSRPLGWRRQRQ